MARRPKQSIINKLKCSLQSMLGQFWVNQNYDELSLNLDSSTIGSPSNNNNNLHIGQALKFSDKMGVANYLFITRGAVAQRV